MKKLFEIVKAFFILFCFQERLLYFYLKREQRALKKQQAGRLYGEKNEEFCERVVKQRKNSGE